MRSTATRDGCGWRCDRCSAAVDVGTMDNGNPLVVDMTGEGVPLHLWDNGSVMRVTVAPPPAGRSSTEVYPHACRQV